MARAEIPPALEEIRNPQSLQSHIAALKALKHDIIGHEQRKELVIHHGIAALVVRNLREAQHGDFDVKRASTGSWTDKDELRFQSVQIVTCLANAGLALVKPLVAAGVVAPLLSQLSVGNTPPRLVVESLRAINAMAEALATDVISSPDTSLLGELSEQLFIGSTIDRLTEIMAQSTKSMAIDEQTTLVLKIICTCIGDLTDNRYAENVAKTGLLDCMCCRLASLVVEMGYGLQTLNSDLIQSMLPAPPQSSLRYLLEALATLCDSSAYRSLRIFYSRHLFEVFPISTQQSHQKDHLLFSEQSSPTPSKTNPLDSLLPRLQAVQSKNEHSFSKAFPALGSFVGHGEVASVPYFNDLHTSVSSRTISADEFGSPLIAWLIHRARNTAGVERIASLGLLANLIASLDQKIMESWSESSRNRDRTLAFLVVPLLVGIIDSSDLKDTPKSRLTAQEAVDMKTIRAKAPIVLATLIRECPALQKAAYDASAVKVLCHMLKKSFDPVNITRKSMWSQKPSSMAVDMIDDLDDASCSLGPAAMTAEHIHQFQCRHASLLALSALAQKEDSYRKTIIEMHVMGCIVDSMIPYSDGIFGASQPDGKEGNPWFVIVAACKLATALSRSVGILRTNLIDASIAKPALALLNERNEQVKLAGTDIITNLVLQFSPMREELVRSGVTKLLCEHAHSSNLKLRASALWALKHLCTNSMNEIKVNVLEELGTSWLMNAMSGELPPEPVLSHMAASNAAGVQVDLLNATGETIVSLEEDDGMDSTSDDEERGMYIIRGFRIPALAPSRRARLRAIKHQEEHPAMRARLDDLLIQLQALDIVRNIISDAGAKQPDMIDHLLQEIGQERLFECLASKLKPISAGHSHSRNMANASLGTSIPAGKRPTLTTPGAASSSAADKERFAHQPRIDSFPVQMYTETGILASAIFCLIHIGNGRPHHRHQLLNLTTTLSPHQNPVSIFPSTFPARLLPQPISPSDPLEFRLLDLTLPLFWHPDTRIRVSCCWMVHNIMWMEDSGDAIASRNRALELRRRGFEEILRGAMGDIDLDVRERVKSCINVWDKIDQMGYGHGHGGGMTGVAGERMDTGDSGGVGMRGGGRSWER